GTLVGVDGWDAMKTAWKGLAQLATGLAFMSNPVLAVAFWATPDKYMPSWLRESRNTMKQTGKALLAWDEWGKNPARAAGGVTFNVLTAVFTDGAGAAAEGAGKAGAVAKAISFAGKAGRVIDPMTYVMKGAGAGLSKIGDISKALKGAGKIDIPELPDNAITLPEGTVHLPDGTVHLPEGAAIPKGVVELPDGSVRLPNDAPLHPAGTDPLHTPEGEPPLFADEHGNIVDHKGDVLMHHDGGPPDITNQPPTGSDVPHTPSPAKQPVLVGAGTHGTDTAAHAGEHIKLGDSTSHDLGDTGRAPDHPATPTIHAGDHLPGSHSGDHLPGGTAHEHGTGPVASHESPHSGQGGHHTDGPLGHGDDPQVVHHAPATGGSSEVTGGQGHDPGGSGHSGAGGGHEPPRVDYSEGDERPSAPTGGMQPDQEATVAEQLASAKMPPADIEKSLAGLRRSEYGAGIAKYISDGNLADLPGYDDLLSQCKQVSKHSDMSPAVYMAMEHATDLQNRGVQGLALEMKVPEDGLDLDVLVKSGDRIEYGAQLKDVASASGLNSATRGIAEKQLIGSIDGQKVAILDVHDTKEALTDKILGRIAHRARITNATFVLRFEDGSITVPANGPTYP
ncbi:hypothetical protein, partial [Streptomyces murinus]